MEQLRKDGQEDDADLVDASAALDRSGTISRTKILAAVARRRGRPKRLTILSMPVVDCYQLLYCNERL
jgi:hypothetical protein